MKKIISWAMSIVLVFTQLFFVNISANAGELIGGKVGENVSYTFNKTTGALAIYGKGDMYNYNVDYDYELDLDLSTSPFGNFSGDENVVNGYEIKTVEIGNGVTSIGAWVFNGCDSITSVTLPDTLKSIGEYAFTRCSSLRQLELPQGLEKIGDWPFGFSGIEQLDVPDNVTEIGMGAFAQMEFLREINLGAGITELPEGAISGCTSLESLVIPDSIKKIGGFAFSNNENLKSIELPSEIEELGIGAFSNTRIESINLPEKLETIEVDLFRGCTNLKSVEIPNSVRSIRANSFSSSGITKINIPENVMILGDDNFGNPLSNPFCYCDNLAEITVDENNKYFRVVDGALYDYDLTSMYAFSYASNQKCLTVPESVDYFVPYATSGVSNIDEVKLPSTMIDLGESAFFDYPNLKKVNIPYGITNLTYCFYNTDLRNIVIPETVRTINNSFYCCSNVDTLCLPKTLTYFELTKFSGMTIPFKPNHVLFDGAESEIATRVKNVFSKSTIHYNANSSDLVMKNVIEPSCISDGYTGDFVCDICNEVFEFGELVKSNGHNFEIKGFVPPTCDELGYTEYRCSVCDQIYKTGFVNALGHKYKTETTNSTCSSKGNVKYTCDVCDYSYIQILELDENNHTGEEVWVTSKDTHMKKWTCCGAITVAEQNHNWNDIVCTDCGYGCVHEGGGEPTCKTLPVCEHCGTTYGMYSSSNHEGKADYITTSTTHTGYFDCCGALYSSEEEHSFKNGVCLVCSYVCEHSWSEYSKGVNGVETRKCKKCNLIENRNCEYQENIIVPAECTLTGIAEYVCKNCGDSFYLETEELGHIEVVDKAVLPTCLKSGLTQGSHCSRCNKVVVAQKVVEALGHNYLYDTTDATCTDDGNTIITCSRCDYWDIQVIKAIGHNNELYRTTVTCTQAGNNVYKCKTCSKLSVEAHEAFGHKFEIVKDNSNKNFLYQCAFCNIEESKASDEVFDLWNVDFINSTVERGNENCYIDVVNDSVINAKDFALLYRMSK